jgi:methionyl-tRNA synthetase
MTEENTKVDTTQPVTLGKPEIQYDDFMKLDLRAAKIITAEEIEGADKLLKLTLDVGELGERTVASGIKEWYSPEELVGKTVVYLANLAPRKLRGVVSQGMIIAAGAKTAVLLLPESDIEPGTLVH